MNRSFGRDVTLNDVVLGLREIFASDEVDIDEVKRLLGSYRSNPKEWRKYCTWNPGKYTRNLIDGGNGKYNVIILCWSEGQGSAIHAHSNSNCFVKVLDGQILETMFAWPENDIEEAPMKLLKRSSVNVDEVTYINDTIGLHRMENPSHTEGTVTLHVYVPAYQECVTFDERSSHRNICQVVFHTKAGTDLDFGNTKPNLMDKAIPAPNEGTLDIPESCEKSLEKRC